MRTSTKIPKTVDEYLSQCDEITLLSLEKVRKAIKSACPNAEEVISYQIPMYKYKGSLVGFASFKNHCSFFSCSPELLKEMKNELFGYEYEGSTIKFKKEKPISSTLVKKIVKRRMAQNDEVAEKKNKARK